LFGTGEGALRFRGAMTQHHGLGLHRLPHHASGQRHLNLLLFHPRAGHKPGPLAVGAAHEEAAALGLQHAGNGVHSKAHQLWVAGGIPVAAEGLATATGRFELVLQGSDLSGGSRHETSCGRVERAARAHRT
jgi:hypothetical protein